MNIEMLQDYIETFRRQVVDSGFKRDLDDYASSLAAAQNNIVALREIATKVQTSLDSIYGGDLPEILARLLPTGQPRPFTEAPHDESFRSLAEDTGIVQQEFFNQLNQLISELQSQVQKNITAIDKIEEFIRPYVSADKRQIAAEGLAVLAVVFNDPQTITSLGKLSKTLATWNRVLPIYHQLLKGEPPADVRIVEVQNGSIDFIINLDVGVALNLVDLFKLGFEMFAAYLSYKKVVQPIVDSYYGNQKLISQEGERETLLLENIGIAVSERLKAQHKEAKKRDKDVDATAIPKKIEQVTDLITAHIVKGNDLKLLAVPQSEEAQGGEPESTADPIVSLREHSVAARRQLRQMRPEASQKLLEAYGKLREPDTE